ncbi:MAG: DUF1080 domain-containing protein [Planctomyces sp.]|nr:DUF1080 domain-containing protein [Planctomyces sp.]
MPSRITSACLLAALISVPALPLSAEEGHLTYETVKAAQADPDFAVQGEYAGEGKGVQVIALGGGKFRAVTYAGGLPGAGWDEKSKSASEGDAAHIEHATEGLKRIERESPTLGAEPPAGAIVLFDGQPETLKKFWRDGTKMTEDGLLIAGATTTETFVDHELHLEFLLPYMPESRGQARGNSGLYVHGRYECQILDSFGLEGENNECGGIYSIARPRINMCLPPLQWQTYDLEFKAPVFEDGQKVKNAVVTIRHNGVAIHENLELPNHTPGGVVGAEDGKAAPIFLQDHGNPVRFRNIWAVKK